MADTRNWTIDDYIAYFSKDRRLFGTSETFQVLREKAEALKVHDTKPVSNDMAYDRTEMLKDMIQITNTYEDNHKKEFTSSGKERFEVVKSFQEFCQQEKAFTDLRANVQYFDGKSMRELKAGPSVSEIQNMQRELEQMKQGPMTEASVIKYTNQLSHCLQACESYLLHQTDRNQRTPVESFYNQNQPAVDNMRDLKTVRGLIGAGKSWEDLHKLQTATHELNGALEKTGAAVSERIKANVNGRPGFFTKDTYPLETGEFIDDYVKRNINANGKLLADNRAVLTRLDTKTQFSDQAVSDNEKLSVGIYEQWEKLPDQKQKDSFLKFYNTADKNEMVSVYQKYSAAIKTADPWKRSDPDWKKQTYESIVHSVVSNPKSAGQYMEAADSFIKACEIYPTHRSLNNNQKAQIMLQSTLFKHMAVQNVKNPKEKESFEAAHQFLRNDSLKKEFISMHNSAAGARSNAGLGYMDIRDKLNMADRNVATSRLAEVMGIGHLIAHSQKMTMKINGVTVTGSFMDFAEGIDNTTENFQDLEKLVSVDMSNINATFAREDNMLNFFDIICAQYDRHEGNFFVKLSEPNAEGKREVIGLQGIDNDQSFGRKEFKEATLKGLGKSSGIDNLPFIDKGMAEKIKNLDREKVEYAVGDLLSKNEIDAIMQRVSMVQKRIEAKQYVELDGEEWNLKGKQGLSAEEQKKYDLGVQKINEAMAGKFPWLPTQFAVSKQAHALRDAKARYEKQKGEHEDYKAKVSEVEKSIADRAGNERTKADRASIFDRILAEKNGVKTVNAPKTASTSQPVAMDLNTFQKEGQKQFSDMKAYVNQKRAEAQKTGRQLAPAENKKPTPARQAGK